MDLQLPESRQFFCDCATGGAKIAHQHWIWAFIIWVTYCIIFRGRHAEDALPEWYLPGLGHWVQELPRIFYRVRRQALRILLKTSDRGFLGRPLEEVVI